MPFYKGKRAITLCLYHSTRLSIRVPFVADFVADRTVQGDRDHATGTCDVTKDNRRDSSNLLGAATTTKILKNPLSPIRRGTRVIES